MHPCTRDGPPSASRLQLPARQQQSFHAKNGANGARSCPHAPIRTAIEKRLGEGGSGSGTGKSRRDACVRAKSRVSPSVSSSRWAARCYSAVSRAAPRLHAGQLNSLEVQPLRDRRVWPITCCFRASPTRSSFVIWAAATAAGCAYAEPPCARQRRDARARAAGTLSEAAQSPDHALRTGTAKGLRAPGVRRGAAYFDVLGLPTACRSRRLPKVIRSARKKCCVPAGGRLLACHPAAADLRRTRACRRRSSACARTCAGKRVAAQRASRRRRSDPFVTAHSRSTPASGRRRAKAAAPRAARSERRGQRSSGALLPRAFATDARPFNAVNCGQLSKELCTRSCSAPPRARSPAPRATWSARWKPPRGHLVLDEVAEMPKDVQVALLRFLDRRGEYHRLGEEHRRARRTTCRSCARRTTTCSQARARRAPRRFWVPIAECTVTVAPLSERPEDVALVSRGERPR